MTKLSLPSWLITILFKSGCPSARRAFPQAMPLPICHDEHYKNQLEIFLKEWPVSRLRTMPLTDYTRVNNDTDESFKGSFCYALEQLTPVGIAGGNALKFAIYAYRNPPKLAHASYDSQYAWRTELGTTAAEAYAKIHSAIVEVATAALAGDYAKIDHVPLTMMLKWKIAFLYQEAKAPGVVGCVKEDHLRDFLQDKGVDVGSMSSSQLHARAFIEVSDQPSALKVGHYIYDTVEAWDNVESPKEASRKEFELNEAKSPLTTASKPRSDYVQLTAKPHAYHWLYALSQGGENLFEDRLANGDIVFDYFPEKSYTEMDFPVDKFDARKKEGAACLFACAIQKGDVVYAWNDGKKRIEGVGIVDGGYEYMPEAEGSWRHRRRVSWIPNSAISMPGAGFATKPLTAMLSDLDKWDWRPFVITPALQNAGLKPPSFLPKVSWYPLAFPVLCSGEFNPRWVKRPEPEDDPESRRIKPTLRILYGPPGTGKTYSTSEEVVGICMGEDKIKHDYAPAATELKLRGNVEFLTFHQNYDYADFIEGYRPTTDDKGQVSYRLEDGVLKRIAKRAISLPNQPFVLIIDEINRGNISKIFGELITLIEADKRIGEKNATPVTLPYSGEVFCLPPNLSIIGTMNTADRSIAVLDTALRRRFEFRRMDPDTKALDDNSPGCGKMLKELNKRLRDLGLTNEQQIGHAWFWDLAKITKDGKPAGLDKEALEKVFLNKILPLLEEWFFGEEEKLAKLVASFCTGYPGQLKYLKENEWVAIATKGKSAE